MSELERAKLIPVSGTNDTPDMDNAVDVQFNPVTLKVSLSNTLKANTGQGNSRATQFVDKSSSTLAVELVFDTTFVEAPAGDGRQNEAGGSGASRIEQGSDVRLQTRKIADKFLKPVESGSRMQAPSRVLFQWGSFEFVGMVQSYDETLDFFSPKGRPLRATVALKLSEDRYQFRSNDSAAQDAAQTPTLSFTGAGGATGADQSAGPVPGNSGAGAGGWRQNALFNGVESPRLPTMPTLALPQVGLELAAGVSAGFEAGLQASAVAGFEAGLGAGTGIGSSATKSGALTAAGPTPAFRYGNSASLGTGIPGAFSPNPNLGLKASSLQQGSLQLRAGSFSSSAAAGGAGAAEAGRSASGPATELRTGSETRARAGVSVAALLKDSGDAGVGFD